MKNKKRIISIAAAIIVLAALTVVMALAVHASQPDEEEQYYDLNKDGVANISDVTALLNYLATKCNHTIVFDAAVPATCTEDGLTAGSHCEKCGKVFIAQEIVQAPGHTEEILPAVPATCTESGLTEGKKCSVCGETLAAQEVIPATGQHTFTALEAVEPTCTETGLTAGFACSVCGQVMIPQEVVPAKGHTVATEAGTAPTCTEPGQTDKQYCSVCGVVLSEHESIPATGHTYKTLPAVAPTCTETGLTVGMGCENCDAIFVAQNEVPALGHDYVDNICTRCGDLEFDYDLAFRLDLDAEQTTFYTVVGIGECTRKSISIPPTYNSLPVKKIWVNAFKGNTDLESVTLPNTVEHILESAFENCENLETIVFGERVNLISKNAFAGCNKLSVYDVVGNSTWTYLVTNGWKMEFSDQSTLRQAPTVEIQKIPEEKRTGEIEFLTAQDYRTYWGDKTLTFLYEDYPYTYYYRYCEIQWSRVL